MGEVWTARRWTRDPDRFDVTRKDGGPVGEVFAPSWGLLRPALAAFRAIEARAAPDQAERAAAAWNAYATTYTAEMRSSYRANRPAWEALVARPRVVLVCYCVDPARCHRGLLAGILGKLGADVRGELPPEKLAPAGGLTDRYAAGASSKRRTG